MNQENEKLDKIFRDKISDFPTNPPDHVWNTIAQKRQKKGYFFTRGIAASLLILLVAGFSAYWIFWKQEAHGPATRLVEHARPDLLPDSAAPVEANPLAAVESTTREHQEEKTPSVANHTFSIKDAASVRSSEPAEEALEEMATPPLPSIPDVKTRDFIAMSLEMPKVNLESKIAHIHIRPVGNTSKPGVLKNLGEELDQVGIIFGNLREAKDQFFSFNFKKEHHAN